MMSKSDSIDDGTFHGPPDEIADDLSLFSVDSRDDDDFVLAAADNSDDDSSYHSSSDDSDALNGEEEEALAKAPPLTPWEVQQLLAAQEEVGLPAWNDPLSAMSVDVIGGPDPAGVAASATTRRASRGATSGYKPTAKVNKQYSIAHEHLQAGQCVFFSIDLEHGGDRAGILQLSVETFNEKGERLTDTFDEYVKPPAGAPIPATQTALTGLSLTDPRIQNADTIQQVWPRFVSYIESKLDGGSKKGVMVAWGGKSCDCEWLFRITEVWHPETLHMPAGLDYFMDPSGVMKNYTSCRLHNSHTSLEGYGLEMTWCYIKGETELPHAHSSLVDCKAQTDVVLDARFLPFIDRYTSIIPMDEVWVAKRAKAIRQQKELSRQVPPGWTEDNTTTWTPPRNMQYTGPAGGGECGPSTKIKSAIAQLNGLDPLVNLFLFLWPKTLLQQTAENSEKYARADWVKETVRMDHDGNQRKRSILQPCTAADRDRRHRHPDGRRWINITIGYILAFLSILMLRGAYGVRSVSLFWEEAPEGVSAPFVQNLLPRDNFVQMRRYLHFVDSEALPLGSHVKGWHPLQKIIPVLKVVQLTMQAAWTLGKNIVIDESMILYNGRAIQWVQYLPQKPIKHGIKVFALCCATTGVLISFLVYTGKDSARPGEDWTAIGVVDRLLRMADLLTKGVGRTLYTDNWYTSIALMEHCYKVYGFFLVGTYVLTKKLSRSGADFPFHKLSNPALKLVARGWARRATKRFGSGVHSFIGQATTWKDKKQVGFVHNECVEPIGQDFVLRYSPVVRERLPVPSVQVVKKYATEYNGVDRKDRDTSDWTVSVRTNRYYLRIFFWQLDASIHMMYNIAIRIPSKPEWKERYGDKNKGRRRFQIDLALAIADYAIRLDWDGDLNDERGKPAWMRQRGLVPCDCGKCFFCKTGRTNGITHNTVTKPPPHRQVPEECDELRQQIRRDCQSCAVCYAIARDQYTGPLKGKDKFRHLRSQCNETRLGCKKCDLVVCPFHWAHGPFNHNPADFHAKHH